MNLTELRKEIERLQRNVYTSDGRADEVLQGIKQTVEAVDNLIKYTFDDFRDDNDAIKDRQEWQKIKELLNLTEK